MFYINLSMEEADMLVHKGKGPMDLWKEKWVEDARDRVHNLDLDIPEHEEVYNQHVKTFIMFNEVNWEPDEKGFPKKPIIKLEVYDDTATPPNKTIGFGFNMDAPGAEQEWKKVFGDKVSFEKVLNGKEITNEQAKQLLDYQIIKRRGELQKFFGKYWDRFKPNEKMTTESLYFNNPSLVRRYNPKSGRSEDTNFSKNMKKYVDTNDPKYLKEAYKEVKYKSNKTKNPGIQNRRNREANALDSDQCPMRSKPNDDPIPQGTSMKAEVSKTVVPRGLPNTICKPNDKYYIWRCQHDDKVRLKHQFHDGKIFDIDNPPDIGHPGDDYNCRCIQDFNIPDFVDIDTSKKMIRKHITNLFELPNFCIK
ncbi:hypothetical protein phytr_12160 [Candidatus Phycorickettsia trachydisci]|uniref:Phage head morphogenesis domain-containing protein n=1 Tax=Candidatus Phycorickettsia trachydisci TaxID=2115978 RepID=A0A2P1PA44_9RICK|nr:phage minor head protein [Candidatus Phycorickettsia trachydisci]AVP88141.1 hypothetical protein phytr_12160 [Candidatus Phycorickettsia trachydisci]